MAALGAQLADVQNSIDTRNLFNGPHIHGRAAVNSQNKLIIGFCQESDGLYFSLGQQEITGFCFPVSTFTGLAAEDINAGISITVRHICIGDFRTIGEAEIVEKHAHDGIHLQQIDTLFLFLFVQSQLFLIMNLEPG